MLPSYLGVLHETVWLTLVDFLGQIRQHSLVDGGISLRMDLRLQKNRVIANYYFFLLWACRSRFKLYAKLQ